MTPTEPHPGSASSTARPLYVRMLVPIECRSIVSLPAILFAGWLPMNPSEYLVVDKGRLRMAIWFDRSSLNYPAGTDPLKSANILAHAVVVEIAINGLGDEFIQ